MPRRVAEATYGITGLWVQRLALEDVRQLSPNPLSQTSPTWLACAARSACRGYTYFYVPWRRYRVNLEPTGVTALDLTEIPLDGSCWQDRPKGSVRITCDIISPQPKNCCIQTVPQEVMPWLLFVILIHRLRSSIGVLPIFALAMLPSNNCGPAALDGRPRLVWRPALSAVQRYPQRSHPALG